MYCSDACKMAAYRRRRDDKNAGAQRAQEQHRQDAVMRRLADSFAAQLAGGRMSQTQVKEMSVRLAGIAYGQLGQGRLL
jgi:hypothetical protein